MTNDHLNVIGGGLSGCEAAWQAASRGIKVRLYEMRPHKMTEAHTGGFLAELVCSNSLGSTLVDRASGLLKEELRHLGSLLLKCAEQNAVPAGNALAVDRENFAHAVSEQLEQHENIEIIREEVTEIPKGMTVIASGPLTSQKLAQSIAKVLTGEEFLYFFDAIAPIVTEESIDKQIAFAACRRDQEKGDYFNCPFTEEEYNAFVDALVEAERIELKSFEKVMEQGVRAGSHKFFEGCLPVEILAQRGKKALAFGPMRPVGLIDPRTDQRPYAVLQLRRDNVAGSLYNLVGFQTNLKFPEQNRIFRMIPGLENCQFARYGQMHRNTFIAAPKLLQPTLQTKEHPDLLFAGQLTGVEGYAGNIATGLIAGYNAYCLLRNKSPLVLSQKTMLGALCYYITHAAMSDFQPMKANFGILPSLTLPGRRNKRQRAQAYSERALQELSLALEGFQKV